MKEPTVITIHSRVGGVGKTSIAFSAAIQLAAMGKKTALVELDTQGPQLLHMLPLDVHTTLGADEKYIFQDYKQHPFFYWPLTGSLMPRNGTHYHRRRDTVMAGESHLVFSSAVQLRATELGVAEKVNQMQKCLGIFPLSAFLSDTDGLNQLVMPKEVPIALLGETDFDPTSATSTGHDWEEHTNQFMKGFVLKAVAAPVGSFHQHVNTTLVKPLLTEQ